MYKKLNNIKNQIEEIVLKEMAKIIGMALPTIRKNVQILKNNGTLIRIREGSTKKVYGL